MRDTTRWDTKPSYGLRSAASCRTLDQVREAGRLTQDQVIQGLRMVTVAHWCVTCDDVPVPRWGYQCPACALLPDKEQERDPRGDAMDRERDEYERSIGG